MKILHVSDNHGYLGDELLPAHFIVHTGDFCPNRTFGIRSIEETYQPYWIETRAAELRAWIGDRPILVVHGNHDFVDTVPHLRRAGIEAYNLDDKRVDLFGLIFHGFPWVPWFGDWNNMIGNTELTLRTNALDLEGVDVLAMHSPIYGVLDRNQDGERCGSKPMREYLQNATHVPRYVLHGHIHESHGLQSWSRGMIVSNAATTQRVIDVG